VSEPHYNINVYWSGEDDYSIADVPDLRPCSAHGDAPEQAIAHVGDAIEGWLAVAHDRGFPLPEPRYRPAIYAARDAA
jgi:predicted RNase H-like HicB family nuclease